MEDITSLRFHYAHGEPHASADFRTVPEDFIVVEQLGFNPSGHGEHLYVKLQKRGENTQWVADKLAGFLGIKSRDIGFSGMKDRQAVTSQWFSAYLPRQNATIDWSSFAEHCDIDVKVLVSERHGKKLRRGTHLANRFTIRLRNITASPELSERLERIAKTGVPNYFGEQRFGRDRGNLISAQRWFLDGAAPTRRTRGIIMSAARAYLFNLVLSERVAEDNWQRSIPGDILDENSLATGPLWGRGLSPGSEAALSIEERALAPLKSWCEGLEHVGLQQERRCFVLRPREMRWTFSDTDLELVFILGAGEFATSLLREVCLLRDKSTVV